jgi:hypothetical protein
LQLATGHTLVPLAGDGAPLQFIVPGPLLTGSTAGPKFR